MERRAGHRDSIFLPADALCFHGNRLKVYLPTTGRNVCVQDRTHLQIEAKLLYCSFLTAIVEQLPVLNNSSCALNIECYICLFTYSKY